MKFGIWYFALVVALWIYFFLVIHVSIFENVREWWEPLLLPFVMPFIWFRNGGLIELMNCCIFLGAPFLLFFVIVRFAKFIITLAT